MIPLFDLHCHMLSNCDDGAENDEEMFQMLEMAYANGIRGICLTPHFHYGFYGDNREKSRLAFERLKAYGAEKHPDLELYLGNELFYHQDALTHVRSGACRTLNGGRYLLFDFTQDEGFWEIQEAIFRIAGLGYRPVLAHTERYTALRGKRKQIEEFVSKGCIIQISAGSLFGEWGSGAKRLAKKLLRSGLVHAVATDAHHATVRKPELAKSVEWISEKYGEEYARELFYENPRRILNNEQVGW